MGIRNHSALIGGLALAFCLPFFSDASTAGAVTTGPVAIEDYGRFYDFEGAPVGEPGDLIRIQEVEALAPNSRAWRVLYISVAVSGELIPVSGLVAVPTGITPAEGRDIVSWAHGTKGVNDGCAPSRGYRFVHNFFEIAPELLEEGWVAVATDYEGLGTPGVHPYMVSVSEARGQMDIVRAARQIPEVNASARYVGWGRSQGGHATLALAERERSYAPELELLGVVAAAPSSDLPITFAGSAWYEVGFNWLLAVGLSAAWDVDLSDYYDADAIAEINELLQDENACYAEFDEAIKQRGGTGMKISGYWGLRQELKKSSFGNHSIDVPVLISQGSEDEYVPKTMTDSLVDRLCEAGTQIKYLEHEGESHNDSTYLHMPELLQWTRDRFAGKPAKGCLN